MHPRTRHPDGNPLFAPLALAIHLGFSSVVGTTLALPAKAADSQDARLRYDIPAGPLGEALNRFAQQASIAILFRAQNVAGLSSPGLQGNYGIEEGFTRLLQGSGYAAVRGANGYALVAVPETDKSAENSMELDAMRVEDNSLGTITEHTKSYTPGTVASATRLVLTPRETPQTVTVVTRQHMDDFNLTSIDKVMQHTPGITVTSRDSERSEYYARGFAITNFQYDGIPIQRLVQYSSGNTLSDMIAYDRIEIIKGASGITTGSGGPGATLNLVRKKPTHELSGHATAEAGRWDNYRTEWDLGGPLSESGNIRGRVVGAFQDQHSFMDHYKTQTKAYYGILEVDLSPNTLLTFGADYNQSTPTGSSWGGIPLFDAQGDEVHVSRSFNPGASWSAWEQFSRSYFTQLDHNFDNGWVSRAYYTYQTNGYDAQIGSIGYSRPENPYLLSGRYRGKTKSQALEVYASGPFELLGREHDLVIGASAYRNHWQGNDWRSARSTIEDFYGWSGEVHKRDWGSVTNSNDQLTLQRAVYATAHLKPTDKLAFTLGARVTNYRLSRDVYAKKTGEVTPFAGVVYDLNDNFSLYASYTSIFLPSNYRDENGGILQPDEGDSYEGGIKGEWFNGRLNASLAYFEIREDNRAEYAGFNTERNESYFQGIKAKTKGLELEVSGELTPGWNIQAGYTWMTIRRDDNNRKITTETPEHQFKAYTTYRLPGIFKKLTIGGGANYQGTTWMDVSNPVKGTVQNHQEAFWLVNLMSKYQITDKLSATLNINNLFDKFYYTNIGYYNTKAYGEPRNMMLTTRWDF
ncbi:TonB-dependent siderophore receptor [Azomonas macrocytogenes]|uniref:Outer membrane receptor for ferric coprogen and ferric-rhodotorulic acid n=1 Tax=Azomonas macrocytogenes TaxID=69962 RepID=A0A839T4H7_AZOMA|nr:TonB-dependent siderophore receptor [Azomonas macrocytogenes]MBB3103650.1 outer membrane receptor for ferric coprogen and ferric-rhodotorulic acid [Azomonas macrocytogenes]